ncbi:hypothetical protein ZWY2020_001635 [Hordeum vulgare]|nr:hypothetical protein ZWY2020_001635 [Hordeum vulgare]
MALGNACRPGALQINPRVEGRSAPGSCVASHSRLLLLLLRPAGSIPPELGNLTALRQLFLGYFNQFDGGIPADLGRLASLVHLDLASCGCGIPLRRASPSSTRLPLDQPAQPSTSSSQAVRTTSRAPSRRLGRGAPLRGGLVHEPADRRGAAVAVQLPAQILILLNNFLFARCGGLGGVLGHAGAARQQFPHRRSSSWLLLPAPPPWSCEQLPHRHLPGRRPAKERNMLPLLNSPSNNRFNSSLPSAASSQTLLLVTTS